MTDGTSQGLFIVVAIVIFGIFVGMSYVVFGSEGLTNDLKGIFEDSILQVTTRIESPLKIDVSENSDGSVKIIAYNQNKDVEVSNLQYLSKESGQNLLKNSNFVEPLDYARINYGVSWYGRGVDLTIDNTTVLDGYPTLKAVTLTTAEKDFYVDLNRSVSKGDNITISFYAKSLVDTKFDLRFGVSAGNGVDIVIESVNLDSEFKRYTVTLVNQGQQNNSLIFKSINPTTVWMTKLQIEYGTEATEWKPYAVNNKYNTQEDSLELITDKNGKYEFLMLDTKGNEYTESVTIDIF